MNGQTMHITEQHLHAVLTETFGIRDFRPSQKEIIGRVLEGGHSLVLMPTGMGKSLCYQLPALVMDGLTVVISPLISLMKDQVDSLKRLSVDAEYINSSLDRAERARRYRTIAGGGYRLLYVAPERFRNREFLEVISKRKISLLALDEAHCVSQWGNDFRPDYSRIGEFREVLGNPVTIALTATATREVQDDIIRKTGIAPSEMRIFNEGICRHNLSLETHHFIHDEEKFEAVHKLLGERKGAAIVYFNLIGSIERFAAWLEMKRVRFRVYHGKLNPEKRRTVQREFLDAPDALMLATNAFGMGIDRPDIRMIIHAEIPASIESYYQEIGRAGRDGLPSRCALMYCEDDLAVQIQFLEWKNPDAPFIRGAYRLMESLGDALNSHTYEDLQEKLVYKHRADHRLQTVLNLFDIFGVTAGSLDTLNLKLVSGLPGEIISEESITLKRERDRKRLIDMLQYAKTEACRRDYIHDYFGAGRRECGNCDNCNPGSPDGASGR